jgi:hypothetical protein
MFSWSKPVARPKLKKEHFYIRVAPVPPIPSYILALHERYLAAKEALLEKKSTAEEKLRSMQVSLNARVSSDQGKYRAPGKKDDTVTLAKSIELSKQIELLSSIGQELDALVNENRSNEEYMSMHATMEESYIATKALEEESRRSWATLYSSACQKN